MNEMKVEKWWNEICGRRKQEKTREKSTQTPFRPPRNPHGVDRDKLAIPAMGGVRQAACAHVAAFPQY